MSNYIPKQPLKGKLHIGVIRDGSGKDITDYPEYQECVEISNDIIGEKARNVDKLN